FVQQMNDVLDSEIDKAFSSNPLPGAERQTLKAVIARVNLTVPNELDPNTSGIAVAGLGNEELFPVLWNCHVRSLLPSRMLQRTPAQCEPLRMPMTAMIRPFAQGEMVYSFMHGIDPNLRQMGEAAIGDLVGRFSDQLAAVTGLTGAALDTFRNN